MTTIYLALLRGINVGGKNKLPMQNVRAMFVAAGCENVQTCIQSGNIVFNARAETAALVSGLVSAQIQRDFGYNIPVVLRTAEQLREVTLHNPYLQAGADADTLHVVFLANAPDPQSVALLDVHRSPPDTFHARGQEIYLHLPQGAARTKFTNAYFDAKLKTVSTQRNWRTVTTLLTLMETNDV